MDRQLSASNPNENAISRGGNPYLRKMFIHGARAVVLRAKPEGSYLGQWMKSLEGRATRNVVIVATANRLARISWAVLSSGENYHPMPPRGCQLDEVTLKFVSQKSAEEQIGRKNSQMACPRTCVEIRVFHDRGD